MCTELSEVEEGKLFSSCFVPDLGFSMLEQNIAPFLSPATHHLKINAYCKKGHFLFLGSFYSTSHSICTVEGPFFSPPFGIFSFLFVTILLIECLSKQSLFISIYLQNVRPPYKSLLQVRKKVSEYWMRKT